jgi:AcrR family transcriptional regulator
MELRERIIEEALCLFFRNGIKSVTMSDIANHLGISKRTLYENFDDKERLLTECLMLSIEKKNRAITDLIAASENAIDAIMRIYAIQLNDMHKITKSLVYDLKKYHSQLHVNLNSRQEETLAAFLRLFEEGIAQGLVRDDLNFEMLLWLLKAQFKMLMETDFLPTDKFSIAQFVEAIILNFVRGIATAEGNIKVEEALQKLNNK